jgi:hypothetical protein
MTISPAILVTSPNPFVFPSRGAVRNRILVGEEGDGGLMGLGLNYNPCTAPQAWYCRNTLLPAIQSAYFVHTIL